VFAYAWIGLQLFQVSLKLGREPEAHVGLLDLAFLCPTQAGLDAPGPRVSDLDGRPGAEAAWDLGGLHRLSLQRALDEVHPGSGVLFGRSGWTGQHATGLTWAGDQASDFWSLRTLVACTIAAAGSGFSNWSHDVGGYLGHRLVERCPPELLVRWAQLGCFTPLMQAHGRFQQEAWTYDGQVLDDYREAVLRSHLWSNCHLVHFEPGRIELRLAEAAPRDLPNRLGQLLGGWTGQRWVVSVSREQGEPSLREQAEQRARHLRSEAEEHPLVRAVLETFPGATIEAVRELAPLEPPSGAPSPDDGNDGEDVA